MPISGAVLGGRGDSTNYCNVHGVRKDLSNCIQQHFTGLVPMAGTVVFKEVIFWVGRKGSTLGSTLFSLFYWGIRRLEQMYSLLNVLCIL